MLTQEENFDIIRILQNEKCRLLEMVQKEMVMQREFMDESIACYENDILIVEKLREKLKEILSREQ